MGVGEESLVMSGVDIGLEGGGWVWVMVAVEEAEGVSVDASVVVEVEVCMSGVGGAFRSFLSFMASSCSSILSSKQCSALVR